MHHVIVGYGYCGFYLASYLREQNQRVTTISRHLDESRRLADVTHLIQDVFTPLPGEYANCTLYYLIPPPATGREDRILRQFLRINALKPQKVVYFGSSSVYGDQQGNWVDEQTSCKPVNDRQFRRLDAERQWQQYSKEQAATCVLLRVAGIYGPDRLPIQAALDRVPVIRPEEAPFTNHIYVKDLVKVAASLAVEGIFNVADGQPSLMGSLQQQVAMACKFPTAAVQSFEQAWQNASPMKREFMQSSKRLRIFALQEALADFRPGSLTTAVLESLKP